MADSLWISSTGMMAQEANVDVIANNLANVNTVSFKKGRAEFKDLVYQLVKFAGAPTTEENAAPIGLEFGLGTYTVGTQKIHTQGDMVNTGNPYDLAISGEGFFQVALPEGAGYTRDGSFKINETGQLVTTDGYGLEPPITIPENAVTVSISTDGIVSITTADTPEPTNVGQIQLVRFLNPAGLESIGNNLYKATVTSGTGTTGNPGQNGLGATQQGFLEMSNVDVAEEMIRMIIGQRAYEVNSKAIQVADQMKQQANSLRR